MVSLMIWMTLWNDFKLTLECFKLQDEVICEGVRVCSVLQSLAFNSLWYLQYVHMSELMQRVTVLSYIMSSVWAFIDYFAHALYRWVQVLLKQSIKDVSEDRS